jgi:two-component system cell cycle sensor histidine kinase/response regulator CckA
MMARPERGSAEEPSPSAPAERALHETEDALERARKSLRSLLDASREVILVHRQGVIVYANDAALGALGYGRGAGLVGKPFLDVVEANDRMEARHLGALGDDGVSVAAPRRICLLREDGTARATEMAAMPIAFDGVLSTAVLATDVTDRERTLAHLVRADRLAALGTLCAGAAHEINNPLTYTLLNIEHTLRALRAVPVESGGLTRAQLDDMIESLSRSMAGATRVSELGRSLTLFARGGGTERRCVVGVQGALESSIQMSMHEIRHRARLVRDFEDVSPVVANETCLGQVFINLLVNAAQAIPEGDVENNEVRVSTRADEQGNVVIEVSDTGGGIAPDALSRIFDPFYTSKLAGAGTGLGLSISHGTIEALGGRISVTSTPGVGSTFRVTLPPCSYVPRAPPAPENKLGVAGRAAHVLVVDDEEFVGDAIVRALAPECRVTHAASGREALALLSRGASYDMILCDVMIPDLSVMDLHAETARVAPTLADRFVFMTGGAFAPSARAFLEKVGSPCLEKPLGLDKLREVVRGLPASAAR